MKLIENAWEDLHRLWSIRASIMLSVFLGVSGLLAAFVDTVNPWVLVGVSMVLNGLVIPILRLIKQREPAPAAEPEA
ncbi:hypothetical protein [Bradyrhizobium stylosanthis]|uniref:Uncharacterized protein n=1 Tax=Bradyrhizobium stylosanthis TaxID=1803665 RepID=A0A560CXL0_9BRAD|nr:hypothetical protein [Bradyrhizobium stylosanthis]TWA89598.1 hypothetical protein FBZ96_11966 [Bradyrhizobium stylosanthis]